MNSHRLSKPEQSSGFKLPEGCPGLALSKEDGQIWGALIENPAVGVGIVDITGKVCFVNRRTAQLFLDKEPDEIIGHNLRDLYPKEWVDERMIVFERMLETGKPAIMRHIRNGVQLQSVMTFLDTPEDKPKRVLTITHEGQHMAEDEDERFEVFESEVACLGQLGTLSPRELEVLALLGHGMTINQIAQALYRSPKTIENHRMSIARKLNESNRAKLIEFAKRAGLELRDAELKRVE